MDTIKGLKRTYMCGELREEHIGETVTLMGWVAKARNMGGLVFVDIRDRSGISQIVFEPDNAPLQEKATSLHMEYVIAVTGKVRMRSNINENIPTGKVEIEASELRILNTCEVTPFVVTDDVKAGEDLRLKYRYLDLRRPTLVNTLQMRHRVTQVARRYFDENGFLEIETPILTKSTPEGARDYLVPSRVYPGNFFALPQSPQQYKQLLMLGGMDRYIQIAKCFRDEDLRADRQPEFTQIDLEMSFVEEDDVMNMNEGFLKRVFKEVLDYDVTLPLPRITWQEAMDRFGSDKPDTRFGLELCDMSDLFKDCGFGAFADTVKNGGTVRAINAKGLSDKLTRKTLDNLVEFVKTYKAKGMAWLIVDENEIRGSIAKFFSPEELSAIADRADAKAGDVILFVADLKASVVYASLGALRCEIAKRFDLIPGGMFNLLWVTDFPLLEYDEEENRFVAMHHPFTSPKDEDIALLDTDPGKVRAKAYDIVLNGYELGGGSIRIYDAAMQQKMFETLGFTPEQAQERFGYLLNAFRYGTPPHGGLAYGLDRIVMLMAGADSIRDVIAFPKVKDSGELMIQSPDVVDQKQLDELGLAIVNGVDRFANEE
ncbi:MAG: aspartate--tRNA ligase [Clostridia bacterium]|nr:aspartate--tRNA ligase [Clostridia bacterium]